MPVGAVAAVRAGGVRLGQMALALLFAVALPSGAAAFELSAPDVEIGAGKSVEATLKAVDARGLAASTRRKVFAEKTLVARFLRDVQQRHG